MAASVVRPLDHPVGGGGTGRSARLSCGPRACVIAATRRPEVRDERRTMGGMKATSHGIVLLAASAELLLCHATGTRHWDIPKGGAEPGESSLSAALREAREECGLELEPSALHELGAFAYRPDKDLVLHAALIDRVDTAQCVCSSRFVNRFGRERPEMDDFRWTRFDEIAQRCAKNMSLVLTARLSLPTVLVRLQDPRQRTAH
jgi:8-oxo-dGTP pyrophosphatase MutT (NUDIX family)